MIREKALDVVAFAVLGGMMVSVLALRKLGYDAAAFRVLNACLEKPVKWLFEKEPRSVDLASRAYTVVLKML